MGAGGGTLGVGVVGCGAAAQALHLPTLASLPQLFQVTHLVDAAPDVAATLAAPLGARHGTELDALLADAAVDVVLVATPDAYHARHAIAACRAGKRAVLLETPIALTPSEARAVVRVSAETGVPVQVGTMHRYDPAFCAALPFMEGKPDLVLMETFVGPSAAFRADAVERRAGTPLCDDGEAALGRLGAAIHHAGLSAPAELGAAALLALGLSTHDLALLRTLLGEPTAIEHVGAISGGGLQATLQYAGTTASLVALPSRLRHCEWRLRWIRGDRHVEVRFPQPWGLSNESEVLVHEGLDGALRTTRLGGRGETGFRAQWRHLHAVARGEAVPLTPAAAGAADVALIERLIRAAAAAPEKWSDATGVALLGAGSVTAILGPVLEAMPEARVAIVASRRFAHAERRASRFGCEATSFEKLDALVARRDVDAVLVAGPPSVHLDHARAAVAAGRDAIVETPLCRTLAEADEMELLAAAGHARIGYAENHAFAPLLVAASQALATGRVGRVRSIHAFTLHRRPGHGDFLRPDYGGGALFDLGAHTLWWAWALAGFQPVAGVRAALDGLPGEGDVYADVQLRYADGLEARVEVSWRESSARAGARAEGDDAVLEMHLEPESRLVLRRGGAEERLPWIGSGRSSTAGYAAKMGYMQLLEAFVAAFRSGAEPRPDVSEGRAILEMTCAAYASAGRGGDEIALPFTGDRRKTPYQHWRG